MKTYRFSIPHVRTRYYHVYPDMVIQVKQDGDKYIHRIISRAAAAAIFSGMRAVATIERI